MFLNNLQSFNTRCLFYRHVADRFIYLPLIGLLLAIAWTAGDPAAAAKSTALRSLQIGAAMLLVISAMLSWRQIGFWKNSVTLWEHAIEVTGPNPLAHNNLAYALFLAGKYDEALKRAGEAARLRSDFGEPRLQMGMIYDARGQLDLAIDAYREALKIHSNWPLARKRLADDLAKAGKPDQAIEEYEFLLQLVPGDPETSMRLADLFSETGLPKKAVDRYREALRATPDQPVLLNNLSWILATSSQAELRNGKEAVALAQKACELTKRKQPLFIGTLAAAYAEAGQFDDAIRAADEAATVAHSLGFTEIEASNQHLKEVYRNHQPFRAESK